MHLGSLDNNAASPPASVVEADEEDEDMTAATPQNTDDASNDDAESVAVTVTTDGHDKTNRDEIHFDYEPGDVAMETENLAYGDSECAKDLGEAVLLCSGTFVTTISTRYYFYNFDCK